jgi:hypothetical protein
MIDQVMKSLSCRDPKMEAYCQEVRPSRTSFMASSSTTSHVGITRQLMNS